MANKDVTLQLVRRPQYVNSGGHIGSQHTGPRPLGKLAKTSGRTGVDGCFSTTYTPAHISGWVGINGSMLNQTAGADPLIGAQGFGELLDGADYNLIGTTASHPFNHYGTPAAVNGLMQIANDYLTEFGPLQESQKIHYNDISLEYGGKFDLNRNWLSGGSHAEHREGINCDTRSNNIPTIRWVRLNQIFFFRGSTNTNDETDEAAPHWHLRFLFGAPGLAAERTPHTFVEGVFGAALDRESSQAEYEEWLARITNAKGQGQSQLLLEARTFEQEQFDSSEYIARQRTDEEFITDVFWSHLFREPTEHEAQDWLDHLHDITWLPQLEQRMQFLNDFEALPEFQSVVFGIVDPMPPPQPTPTP